MANTIKTLSSGDITRKALAILHNNLVFTKMINKQYDDRFARSGAKNGGTLLIREPNQFTVRSGAIMDTQDVTETTQTLTLATQRGVDINFSSAELTLSLDDFADRILNPAMSRLAAEVDKTVIAACYPDVANHVHTSATDYSTAPTLAVLLAARAKLSQNLAPASDRMAMVDALAANSIITAGYNIFNPAAEISKQYDTGLLGQVYGFKFYESEMTPVHTVGVITTGETTNTGSITNGTATIVLSAVTANDTKSAGDIFTIAGVYDVNPETKVTMGNLKQWSITAAQVATAASTWTVAVSPTPYKSGAKQNCVVSTSSTTATVVFLTSGGVGTSNTAFRQNLVFHKDAFTFVSADLELPKGVDFAAREVFDGISLRVVRNFDIVNDRFPCRIDVLFGQKTIYPGWACRISSAA